MKNERKCALFVQCLECLVHLGHSGWSGTVGDVHRWAHWLENLSLNLLLIITLMQVEALAKRVKQVQSTVQAVDERLQSDAQTARVCPRFATCEPYLHGVASGHLSMHLIMFVVTRMHDCQQ
jgi:hypothetical protein